MSMISKQIDDLRAYAKDRKGELAKLVSDAADTIEMLSAKLSAANMERSARYYHGGWIPCNERLPKAENCPMDCLVTRKSKFIGNYTDMAVCEENGTWTHEDWDAIVLGDVEDGKSTGLISTRDDNIIAWMPLPEPYEEEKRNA